MPKSSQKLAVSKTLSSKSYQHLLTLLRKEIERGQKRINTYIDFEKVRTNWNVGRHIYVHLLDGGGRAPDGLYDRLSEDLNTSIRHIQDTVQFYRLYPKLPQLDLSWTHYTFLMRFRDDAERMKLQERILKEKISVRQLKIMFSRPNAGPAVDAHGNPLKFQRGTLYGYRIMKVNTIQDQESFMTLDCGFDISLYQVLKPGIRYRSGNICTSRKDGETYTVAISDKLVSADIYTYQALIERFIDGDTLLVNVDVGFGIWTRQKLRLRGINCGELGTAAGNRAKKFVEDTLKDCPFVVIKTYKSDKYDRYLVDIFYLPKETDPAKVAARGKYLNQELIDNRLATLWQAARS